MFRDVSGIIGFLGVWAFTWYVGCCVCVRGWSLQQHWSGHALFSGFCYICIWSVVVWLVFRLGGNVWYHLLAEFLPISLIWDMLWLVVHSVCRDRLNYRHLTQPPVQGAVGLKRLTSSTPAYFSCLQSENDLPKVNRVYLHNYKGYMNNLGINKKLRPTRLL